MNTKKLHYYKRLDLENQKRNEEMVMLKYDFAFKSFFFKNPKYLKKFLISVLNLDIDYEKTEITFNNGELPKDMEKEYQKKVDVLIRLKPNTTFNIEVNRGEFDDVKRRNFLYLTKNGRGSLLKMATR